MPDTEQTPSGFVAPALAKAIYQSLSIKPPPVSQSCYWRIIKSRNTLQLAFSKDSANVSDHQFTWSILLNFSWGPSSLTNEMKGEKKLQKGLKLTPRQLPRQCQGKLSCSLHTERKNHMDKKGFQTIVALTSPHATVLPEIKHWSATTRNVIPELSFDEKWRGRSNALHLYSKHVGLYHLPSHHRWRLNGRSKHQQGTPSYG